MGVVVPCFTFSACTHAASLDILLLGKGPECPMACHRAALMSVKCNSCTYASSSAGYVQSQGPLCTLEEMVPCCCCHQL